jgi:hypothetical protein
LTFSSPGLLKVSQKKITLSMILVTWQPNKCLKPRIKLEKVYFFFPPVEQQLAFFLLYNLYDSEDFALPLATKLERKNKHFIPTS